MRYLLLLALVGVALAGCDAEGPTPTAAPVAYRPTPAFGGEVGGLAIDFTIAAINSLPRARDYLWPPYSRTVPDIRQAFGVRVATDHLNVERVVDLGIPPVTDLGVPVERREAATVALRYGARDVRVGLTLERRGGRRWVVAIAPAR
ncbi:MAG TPA: hypothetical protein VFL91_07470 [Thermomicrobiales bacterium]|nr:hypothetical protein [Thermomicrobiales bacterium]